MDIKTKAREFAVKAHMGQLRKNEKDKPMIMHPISVGNLLEEYGYDDNVIAAGYLHDVVEDTEYILEDIEKYFGSDVASLVGGNTEDKSLSWEERKQHTIDELKTLPFRNKVIVCADKINNLEDLMLKFQKTGVRDFSAFNRGEEKQKWYYENIYNSLIYNEDKNNPMFKRLREVLDVVFDNKEDLYLKDTIFGDNSNYYLALKKLHAQKEELLRLKKLCSLDKPFVIEFSGTPRTGKTTTINNLYDFFTKGGFSVSIVEEFTTSKYYKEKVKPIISEMTTGDVNLYIMEEVYRQLLEAIDSDKDIIIIDRSLNDRQMWNYRCYLKGNLAESKYLEVRDRYEKISRELIDYLVVTYADALTSLKRDYNNSLTLEQRRFLNIDNINEYNDSLRALEGLFERSVESASIIDTSLMGTNDVSVNVAREIMPVMRKKYIKSFCKKYNLDNE